MSAPKKTNRPLTVVGLVLAFAMAALEATVVATAMPTVIGDLGGMQSYAWVFTAYLLAATVPVPIYGKLADLYGRKPILLFGIAVFLFGSAASGASQSMAQLITFRAIQGLGAGSMQPVALTIVGDIFDLKERSRMQGVFSSVWGVGGVAGPLVGSFVVTTLGWRWIFYLNVPLGVVAAILLITQYHETIEKKERRIFVRGAVLLSIAIVAALIAPKEHGMQAVGAASAAVGAFVAFAIIERRSPEPILPFELFRRPVIAIASIAGAIVGGVMFVFLGYLPHYVETVLHGTVADAGISVTPMMIAWPIASSICGVLIPKVGFRPLVRLGLALTAIAGIVLAVAMHHGATANDARVASAIFGLGMGFANTALLIAVQTSVAWKERGVATASTMFFRTIGGSLAVGLLGGIVDEAVAGDPRLSALISKILAPGGAKGVDPADVARIGERLGAAFDRMFLVTACVGAIAFVVSLWFPKVEAKDQAPVAAPLE